MPRNRIRYWSLDSRLAVVGTLMALSVFAGSALADVQERVRGTLALGEARGRMLPLEFPGPELEVECDGQPPPAWPFSCPAEYEPCQAVLIAWESHLRQLTELTVHMTTCARPVRVIIVVHSDREQVRVRDFLVSAEADTRHVEFLVGPVNEVWIRDYGPRFILEGQELTVIDHTYNAPRRRDNYFNDHFTEVRGMRQYQMPLRHGGGNFHVLRNGHACATSRILEDNPGMSCQEVVELFRAYLNVELTIYPAFPYPFDETQHIDMWMLPVSDGAVVIGEYAKSMGPPHMITEQAAANLASQGYTVYRTPGWSKEGVHFTYTNAVIVNDQVFIPRYGGEHAYKDAHALSIFEQACPGRTIIPIDCRGPVQRGRGALHCMVMHVPAPRAN